MIPYELRERAVLWVVRQTGHGQRSWAYDPSKVHLRRVDERWRTVCGRSVGRGASTAGTTTAKDADLCKRCFR